MDGNPLGDGAVSKIVFGAGSIGNLKQALPEAAVDELLAEATRHGIFRFDTSPLYGFGLSELRLGHHLRGLERKSFTVSTKVGRYFLPAWGDEIARGVWYAPLRRKAVVDYSRDGILRSLEQSFNRLGIDRIDTVLVHDIDRRNQGDAFEVSFRQVVEEALPLLSDLKSGGQIDAFGIGINEADVALDLMRAAEFDVLMLAGRISLLDHASAAEALAEAQRRGVSVQAASIYNSGLLANATSQGTFDYAPASATLLSRLNMIRKIAERFDVPLQAAAVQFPLRLPAVEAAVVGMSRPSHVRSTLDWLRKPIPDDMWAELGKNGLMLENLFSSDK